MNPTQELKAAMIWALDRTRVAVLLDAGADINVQDNQGRTVLMRAVWMGTLEWCTKLLERDANIQVQDHDGWTAWDTLSGCNDSSSFYSLFLQYGADVNRYSPLGVTALHWVCMLDHRAAVRLLLAQGADPRLPIRCDDYCYKKGQTAYNHGSFWCTPEGRRERLRWDTVSIQEVFIVASELGIVPIPSYLW